MSVVVPVTVSVVPAAMVFVAANVRLLNVSVVDTVSVAAPPLNDTVPDPALNAPPLRVKAPGHRSGFPRSRRTCRH